MRSSASVVTPGATALPASASALAAICPATRIFSITSGVCTHGSVPSRAVGLPTYSGRGIDLGTGSVGDTTPADSAERTGMWSGYPYPVGSGTAAAAHQRPARALDLDRAAHHPAGQNDMWRALGGCDLPPIAGAAAVDLDVVYRRARTLGQSDLDRPESHVEFDDDHRPGEPGLDQIQFDRTHPAYQRQPGGHRPFAVAFERTSPAAQLDAVCGR